MNRSEAEIWEKLYSLAEKYYNHYGNLLIPANFETQNGIDYDSHGYALGAWIKSQREAYKKRFTTDNKEKDDSILTDDKIAKLNKIGMVYDIVKNKWDSMYNLAKHYYEHYGNLLVPPNFKTKDGIDYDNQGYALGIWIKNQREAYKKRFTDNKEKDDNVLTDDKIAKLNKIGMVYDIVKNKWDNMYTLAKYYYEHYGNLLVPENFKTKNGIDYDNQGYALGAWIANQRLAYKKRIANTNKEKDDNVLTDDKIAKLNKIGMVYDVMKNRWNSMYILAKNYYEHYGNLLVPSNFKTKNGIDYDNQGYALGTWIVNQRLAYKKRFGSTKKIKGNNCVLTDDEIEKLNKIGMVYDIIQNQWDNMYTLAKHYYEHYGNLLVPYKFKTKNGYDYDEDGQSLGLWIRNQRTAFINRMIPKSDRYRNSPPLDTDKEEKLLKIGMVFLVSNETWEQKYNLCLEYYKHYGNLQIKSNFKTLNGYTYDENGINLFSWMHEQRIAYKKGRLNSDRKNKLDKIGFIYEVKKNRQNNISLCNNYNLDYNKNKFLLLMPYQVLSAKINYLLAFDLPLINNNKLNPIFNMSNLNIQTIYGISIEQLIEKYYEKGERYVY